MKCPMYPTSISSTGSIAVDNSSPAEVGRKFKFASDLGQAVPPSQIGEKIMDTSVQLSIREILAVSGDVTVIYMIKLANVVFRSNRTLFVILLHPTSNSVSSVDVNSTEFKSYYALPSGHAKVTLDDRAFSRCYIG